MYLSVWEEMVPILKLQNFHSLTLKAIVLVVNLKAIVLVVNLKAIVFVVNLKAIVFVVTLKAIVFVVNLKYFNKITFTIYWES